MTWWRSDCFACFNPLQLHGSVFSSDCRLITASDSKAAEMNELSVSRQDVMSAVNTAANHRYVKVCTRETQDIWLCFKKGPLVFTVGFGVNYPFLYLLNVFARSLSPTHGLCDGFIRACCCWTRWDWTRPGQNSSVRSSVELQRAHRNVTRRIKAVFNHFQNLCVHLLTTFHLFHSVTWTALFCLLLHGLK